VNIFHELTKKPWLPEQARIDDTHEGSAFVLPVASLGLRVLLISITVLLLLFVIAYSERMGIPDWRPLPEPWLLWLNTFVLILSSAAMQKGLVALRQGRVEGVKTTLMVAGAFAFAFLIGQLLVWRQLVGLGYFAAANPANAFFYLLTALHGIHLLGGLIAWTRIMTKMRHRAEVGRLRASMELCTLYWHFLLIVWLVFFTLLLFT
jgi:cytochrome c oxidase subunit 3